MEQVKLFNGKKCKTIKGWIMKATKRALLISSGKVIMWVPKSAIVSDYDEESDKIQGFLIESWYFYRE